MIASLTGTLLQVDPTLPPSVVIDVGGVGYELGVSRGTLADLPSPGTSGVSLFVRMRVSESSVALYGFSTREERTVFDKLVLVPKVGPALALKVLSHFSLPRLAEVVASQDAGSMTEVPGVGAKSAPRILMDLKTAFAKDPDLKRLMAQAPAQAGIPSLSAKEEPVGAVAEATAALLAMGLTPQEAEVVFEGLPADANAEQAVRYALKRIGGR